MKKTLVAALVVAILLLIAAVGIVIYMETGSADPAGSAPAITEPSDIRESDAADTTAQEETTEEPTEDTVGISLPTENPDEVAPEYTWPEDDTGSQETAAPVDPTATVDPDENETPEMEA